MTLTLAAPDANPIRTYSNGLKVVRLTDYIGAARGTLSTVADSAAVAGNVVKDEQTVAIPTTFTTQWGSVADTITIPVADFNYAANSNYAGYLTLRCEGRPPVTARAFEKFNLWNSVSTPNVYMGWDGVVQRSPRVPREHYANYSMIALGGFGPNWDGFSSTNVNIRAWGIAGGATTFAWYLDCLYLIPTSLRSSDTGASISPTVFAWYIGQDDVDPENPATDNEANNGFGTRSVFWSPTDIVSSEDGAAFDSQVAGSAENTEFDWRQVGFFTSTPVTTESYIYWIGLTSRLINYHLIDTEDFASTGPDPTPTGPFVQNWNTSEGYQLFVETSGTQGEFYFAAGAMRFRTYLLSEGGSFPIPANAINSWNFGAYTHKIGSFVSTDPRTYNPEVDSLESFIVTIRCVPTDGIPTNGMKYHLRGVRWTGENTFIERYYFGPRVTIASTGSASVQFLSSGGDATFLADQTVGSSVSVPDNLGAPFWIKLERRFYTWRVKVWADGGSEPSDWLLEQFEPAALRNGVTSPYLMMYPWVTGYQDVGVTQFNNDPRSLPDEINSSGGERGWTISGAVELNAGMNQRGWRFDTDDITVEYDPDSDSVGSYTGANFLLEKYDGSENWGLVHVDPGMCRVAFSDYAPHHFDSDQHGGNIIAWKDTGGHPLQVAAYSTMFFRHYVTGDIPLHRPRVFSVRA